MSVFICVFGLCVYKRWKNFFKRIFISIWIYVCIQSSRTGENVLQKNTSREPMASNLDDGIFHYVCASKKDVCRIIPAIEVYVCLVCLFRSNISISGVSIYLCTQQRTMYICILYVVCCMCVYVYVDKGEIVIFLFSSIHLMRTNFTHLHHIKVTHQRISHAIDFIIFVHNKMKQK